ncbi:murein L,D-transpeptidase [Marinimicrobium sp. ABcell2]|uniref:L,D-transpeptidase family protein n=1 Tax=Marinimicrobium sp. ABcell2 TaxID=3069751 RepID=UPI0027B82006|nr:L,D-transpeptidase family protein [Marinimicrobium sp. ABcell2]MDQ2076089.1 L,D-transpeptidase family protein [Marinimicrobium sp. ABcell2]
MLKRSFLVSLILLFPLAAQASEELREQLRHRLEALYLPDDVTSVDQELYAVAPLQSLYERRAWQPIWFDEHARPSAVQGELLAVLELAYEHGLNPDHYHRQRIVELMEAQAADDTAHIELELLASDALLTLGHHLANGRIDPVTIDPGWLIEREPAALRTHLTQIQTDQATELRVVLESLVPDYPAYRTLQKRLTLQRQIADQESWPLIGSGPLIRPGGSDARLPQIRTRLIRLQDLKPESGMELDESSEHYDAALQRAVVRFQDRHGLKPDGIIGPRTIAALDVSPQERIEQLRANLERWRWLPSSLGEEYILVNIAGFDMRVVSQGETVMEQRVVVGRPYRRTPVFTGRMSYLVLNPSWEVPHKLAVQDQLPRIRSSLNYLDEMGFSVLQGWGPSEVRIDPAEVQWSKLSPRNFPYRLRQSPGPQNALGQVKFMFPNRHNVYLHDTPARGLFAEDDRALSSGCIRVEDPQRLTLWLLSERANLMSPERIGRTFESGQETTVRLNRPLPVHLLYWTAWVDDQGRIQYRGDVYQRDQALINALNSEPKSSSS